MAKLLRKVFNRKKKKTKKKKDNECQLESAEDYEDLHLYEDQTDEEEKYENIRKEPEYIECQIPQSYPRYLLVAAIDLGTSASGYAFSFRNEYETNPLQISTHIWTAGTTVLRSPKTPTCILFNPDKQFDSFGYDAQNKYAILISEKEENFEEWYFYEGFKMSLYENKDLTLRTEIKAENSKSMEAITVFSESLKYLKNHLLKRCSNMKVGLRDEDVLWTLTVPAIWNDGAKLFMRRAAELAGIPRNQLLLALEPEVGAIFCKHIPIEVERFDDQQDKMFAFRPGTSYMVVDAGGGTIDVTVHEVLSENKVKEIQAANGGPWGGSFVNEEYFNFLIELFGKETFDEFRITSVDDYIDIIREFEVKKHNVRLDESRVVIRVPVSMLDIYNKYNNDNDLANHIQSLTKYKGSVEIKKDKLFLNQEIFVNFFTKTVDAIINHLEDIIKSNDNISTILMIGGFSDSVILEDRIRNKFKSKQIIIPGDAGLCVLKGAVLFGHNRDVVECRVLKCTYGIECSNDFIEGVHDPGKKYISNLGAEKCRDVFGIIAKMGESVPREQASKERYVVVEEPDVQTAKLAIYVSTISSLPRYITENGCRKIGYVCVNLEGHKESTERRIYFRLYFGETELKVQYRQDNSLIYKEKLLDLLGENV